MVLVVHIIFFQNYQKFRSNIFFIMNNTPGNAQRQGAEPRRASTLNAISNPKPHFHCKHSNFWSLAYTNQKNRPFGCSKAVFYVFVFDSIHDSTTMHNLSPEIFHWTKFMSKIFFIIEKNALFLHFLSVLLDFFFFLCIFVVSFQGQSTGKCANLMPH